jgi:elongator complex protein 3
MIKESLKAIIYELAKSPNLTVKQINSILVDQSKGKVLQAFNDLEKTDPLKLTAIQKENFLNNITMKKVRTLSGVTTVTVLTKPFPCPGKCIFCPNDVRMPKSYISSEPGAQRAETNHFDPYQQTFNRLLAIEKIGHPTDKIELIVLGGTWTSYPEAYQIWFIKRCFDAMNDFVGTHEDMSPTLIPVSDSKESTQTNMTNSTDKKIIKDENNIVNYNLSVSLQQKTREHATWEELFAAHDKNIGAQTRCVGLVIETRPDEISQEEVIRIRKLGATKVQIGVQSLNDKVLRMNRRGHDSEQTARAFSYLRQAGFKIHAHYMPNLYGSTPDEDIKDFAKLFADPRFRPDELKIYPCSLIEGTELMNFYKTKQWQPYSGEELLRVLTECMKKVPSYCRVTRMIRDIPSQEIVDGNKKTNFRQNVEEYLKEQNVILQEIRSREVKDAVIKVEDLSMVDVTYDTESAEEHFLQFVTAENKIAGFLRLSFSKTSAFMTDLKDAAIVREVHVYGSSLQYGDTQDGAAQHSGLGTQLIKRAIEITRSKGISKLAVISSIGTRKYYEKFGFKQQELYQLLECEHS